MTEVGNKRRQAFGYWFKLIILSHLLFTISTILVILLSVYFAVSISPAAGFIISLLAGAIMLFFFANISLRILFGNIVARKEDIPGSKYLLFLGVVSAAVIIIAFPLGNDAALQRQTEVLDNVSVGDVISYRGKNLFLGIRDYTILHNISGTYTETHQVADSTKRSESYYAAPMLPQGLSSEKIQEIRSTLKFCVWVTNATEKSHYFREITSANEGYRNAVSKALKGKQPSCIPVFLQGYDSPRLAYDRTIHYLVILLCLANGFPLFFLLMKVSIGFCRRKKALR